MQNALIKREQSRQNNGQVEWIDNEPYFTAQTLGEILGYKNPRKSINQVFNQNRDEFEGSIGVLESKTPGGSQQVLVFDEEGAYLITMLAKTERAKEARRRIARIMKEVRRQQFVPREDYQKLLRELGNHEIKDYLSASCLLNHDDFNNIAGYYYSHNLTLAEISNLVGVSKSVISRVLRMYRKTVDKEQLPKRITRAGRPLGVSPKTHYRQLLLPGIN